MELQNSRRILRTASYVVTELTPDEQREIESRPGRAADKLGLLRVLAPTAADLARLERAAAEERDAGRRDGMARLVSLGHALRRAREQRQPLMVLAADAAAVPVSAFERLAGQIVEERGTRGLQMVAGAFWKRLKTAPVGRLHLERIEMYPAGTEQGELVFTVPLSPQETVTLSHKEWSTATEEYESLVQDSFEGYSERGVAEKSDVSMSTENESKHSSAFDFGASYSASYGGVTLSTTVGLENASDDREVVRQSAQRTREVTEKASARTRREHKVSVKLESVRGAEDASFRTVTNPYADRALRLDYFRMMRKWRTDLFRYGLRLTFDVTIPNPGARLWAEYKKVEALDREMRQPFEFPLTPSGITPGAGGTWKTLEATWGAALEPPPPDEVPVTVGRNLRAGEPETFELLAPPGYRLEPPIHCRLTYWGGGEPLLDIAEPGWTATLVKHPGTGPGDGWYAFDVQGFGGDDKRLLQLISGGGTHLAAELTVTAKRREETLHAWQVKSWAILQDAALARHKQRLAVLQEDRDRAWRRLVGKDTLSLRRLEREELIRQTLHWIVGVDFEAAPDDVAAVFQRLLQVESRDLPDNWPGGQAAARHLNPGQWATAAGFGDFVKFIHQAIEWENILYFLYPYFWGSDDLAREKMLFEHPDPQHRDFLRAGYVRVVVPVRPGFEVDFTQLVDQGLFTGAPHSPYLPIAEEIQAFARTNYAGVPPANPERHARPLLYPQQRATWETMQKVIAALEKHRADNGAYPADLSALPGAPFLDAWGNELVYRRPGSGNDYDLLSFGADGEPGGEDLDADISAAAGASLVASWFDYTPTSGIDIEMVAKPPLAP